MCYNAVQLGGAGMHPALIYAKLSLGNEKGLVCVFDKIGKNRDHPAIQCPP